MSAASVLEIGNISVKFGGVKALSDVSLNVRSGERVGIIGPNGAGKTTLFDVICGLRRPSTGAVHIDGRDVTNSRAYVRARMGVGRSFQNVGLMPDESVLTNLLACGHLDNGYRLGDPVLRPRRWHRAERRMEDGARAAITAAAPEVSVQAKVRDLSFASARLTELAALLWASPRLLLLDEPTTGLSVSEIRSLQNLLGGVDRSSHALVVIAHDVGFIMSFCDRVYVLAEGRVIFEGVPQDVQKHPAVIEAYLGRAS